MSDSTYKPRPLLITVLLLAFALRVWRLDGQELRGDEAFGYFFSLRPYGEIIQSTLALREPHPVASYFVQHGWLAWAGTSEVALRFVSLWFGVLAVALIYRLGITLALSPSAAAGAAALLALSPYALWHSQDARMYSMSLALTLASTWLALAWLQRQRWPWAVGYLAVSWLALHTHYFSLFVLAAQTLFVLSRAVLLPRLRTLALNWIGLQGILLALYLPWLMGATATLTAYRGNGDSPGLGAMLIRALSVFVVGESTPSNQRTGWAIVTALLLLWGAYELTQRGPTGRRALWLLSLYLLIPLLATWYSAQSRPIFNERYLIAAAPPCYLLLAALLSERKGTGHRSTIPRTTKMEQGLHRLRRFFSVLNLRNLGMVFVALGMIFALLRYWQDPVYSKNRGWRRLATTLGQLSAQLPADQVRIAQNYPDPTLWYYYRGSVEHVVLPPAAHDGAGAHQLVDQLADDGVQRVILPVQPAPGWDDQRIALAALAARYQLAREHVVGSWPVQLYVLPPAHLDPLDVEFQNGVRLAGLSIHPATLTPGGTLVVHLAWQGQPQQLTGTEKVFVQLLDPTGTLVAQDDRPLTFAEGQSDTADPALYAILLPEAPPPGTYRLITGIYDPAQVGAPRILTTTGADHVEIRELEAEPNYNCCENNRDSADSTD